ncbi:MAG: dephospho-CoA kinase [Clostridiales bacterium]|nr:dephospho-CoA kinase [Clostridiales bacterium]
MMNKRNLREIDDLKELKKAVHIVGLTGGIASGKTVATDALKRARFTVIDADEISRKLFGRGTDGEKLLCGLFPAATDNGVLNRAILRRIISENADEKKKLDGATHPIIKQEIAKEISQCGKGEHIVLSAPLLLESGLSSLCDCVVCITCPTRIRIERLSSRDGVSIEAAKKIIDAQIPDAYRATLSDFCIPSDRSLDDFTAEAVELFQTLFGTKKR